MRPIDNEKCQHINTFKEVLYGQKTGDRVCSDCGEIIVGNYSSNLTSSANLNNLTSDIKE